MKRLKMISFFVTLLVGISHSVAATSGGTVTQTFDQSTHSLSVSAKGAPAGSGTVLRDGEYLKTGKKSLAEVLLANKTIARLGPNTVFNYSSSAHEANLQSGTILFSKPKDDQVLTIKMAGVTAAVTGTTGFIEKEGNNAVLGVIEGTIHVSVGTAKAVLTAGNMLVAAGMNAQVVSFDVPNFVKTSPFFTRFQGHLPNEKYVAHEIAEYNNLAARGFIEPVKAALASGDRQASLASRPFGHETAGNALYASAGSSIGRGPSGSFGAALATSNTASGIGGEAGGVSVSVASAGTATLGGFGGITVTSASSGASTFTGYADGGVGTSLGTTTSLGNGVTTMGNIGAFSGNQGGNLTITHYSGGPLLGNQGVAVLGGGGSGSVITPTGGTGLSFNLGGTGTVVLNGGTATYTPTGLTLINTGTLYINSVNGGSVLPGGSATLTGITATASIVSNRVTTTAAGAAPASLALSSHAHSH